MIPAAVGLRAETSTGLSRHDLARCRIPQYALAVLEALRFEGASNGRLAGLSDSELGKALEFCDKAQLTLILNQTCRDVLPPWVRFRIQRNLSDYSLRFERLKKSLFEIADALENRGIEYVVLKGLTHSPHFTSDPLLRVQGDIDIWCGASMIEQARQALLELGFRSAGASQGRHLPPLIRETHWDWRGDPFAPGLPIPVELHHRLWDEKKESIAVADELQFWDRRALASFDGRPLPVLWKPDSLAFASLHLLMHLLHGDARIQRAWEIANFLRRHAHNTAFWSLWQRSHEDSLRRLEAIVFQLVADWFGSALAEPAREEIAGLPGEIKLWLDRYSLSPIEALFRPNKDELWLHLALVGTARNRRGIFLRRVLPLRAPPRVDEATLNGTPATPALWGRRAAFLVTRACHHALSLVPTLVESVRWSWAAKGPDRGFLRFQISAALQSLGIFVFLVLYNLHLLELGFTADLIGRVASAMSLGTFLGAGSAAAIARRAGLRNTILIAILGGAACAALRTLTSHGGWLLATALLHGICLSWWAVSFSPAIAGLTTERNRPFAFSLVCAAGVGAGILAGLAGGRLPGLVSAFIPGVGSLEANRIALLIASGVVTTAALPAARLPFPAALQTEAKVYPRSRFISAFLVCASLWSLAVGAFNPFFNVFFAEKLRMGVRAIGLAFALSHAGQVLALLAAPWVLRRLGQVRGIACMQFATGLALLSLAGSTGVATATACYVGYTSLQYMSEPGVFSILMSRVAPGERSGASALFFLVTSIGASIAALVAGGAVMRFGYPSVLVASAILAAAAAFLFRLLIGTQACRITEATSR